METCGILPVHKPGGPTSHDVVDRVRRLYDTRRVGHTGTLDPLAEGLLVLCLGSATKISRYLSGLEKTYRATIRLGRRTTTGDHGGATISTADTRQIDQAMVESALGRFRGKIRQQVPAYAAVKVQGRPLYAYAREGREVPVVVREVEIFRLVLEEFANPELIMTVRCSGGTYIRALADDLGSALGCGGCLVSLLRTHVGGFDDREAEKLEDLEQRTREERLQRLRPIEKFLPFPFVTINDDKIRYIRQGLPVIPRGISELPDREFSRGDRIVLADEEGHALAIAIAACSVEELVDDPCDEWCKYERVLI